MKSVKLILVILVIFLGACFSNPINLSKQEEFKINKRFTKGVNLEIKEFNKKLGYQYLFFLFPFSKNILSENNLEELFNLELLSNGFHRDTSSSKKLVVEILDLDANVYDYFFY